MARSYKLRLGDGTTFAVDEKGLVTWLNGGLVDDKTRVQVPGSTQWLSIRQLIAAERTAKERLVEKRIAAQHEAAAETKAAERAVAEARAEEERQALAARAEQDSSRSAQDVARAEKEQRMEVEAGLALARQAHEERVAAEREAARRAEEERRAAAERAEAERRAAAERAEAERRQEAERKAAAEAQRRAEAERKAAAERAEAERRAAKEAERRAAEERELAERRAAEERAEIERRVAAEHAAAERKAAKARQQAELKAEMERRERRAAEERAAAEKAAQERAERERLEAEAQAAIARKVEEERRVAEERRAAAERRAAEERAEAERRAAAERAAAEQRAAEERAEAERRAAEERAADLRAAMASQAEKERRAAEERRAVYGTSSRQVLEPLAGGLDLEPVDDEPAELHQASVAPSLRIALRQIDEAPRPMTMFDDPQTGPEPVLPASRAEEIEAGVTGMMETLRPVLEPIDEQVSGWERWRRRRAAGRAGSPAVATRLAGAGRPAIAAIEGLVPSVLSLGPRLRSALSSIKSWRPARASMAPSLDLSPPPPAPRPLGDLELTAIAELIEREVPAPVDLPRAPDPPPAPIRLAPMEPGRPAAAKRAEPVAAPPPALEKLAVIPFAGGWQPGRRDERAAESEPEQIYDEDDGGPGTLQKVWVWVRRGSIAAVLLLGAGYLAIRQGQWVPQTRDAAVTLFSGMDQIKTRVAPSSSPGSAALGAAVAASSEQLPVLGVETIQLIMSSSGQPLQPVDVLRQTFVALDRARPSLAQPAAAELDSLTTGLAAELPAADGRWLHDYLQRVRARAVTVNYEDTKALWLLSRAARRLPADRLSRVQQVLGAAVAMGLQPRTPAASGPS